MSTTTENDSLTKAVDDAFSELENFRKAVDDAFSELENFRKAVDDAFSELENFRRDLEIRKGLGDIRYQEALRSAHADIIAALADGCDRIIEASARANSGPGPKDKEGI